MTYDLLREATRAARDLADGAPPPAHETRARVLATVRERRRRRLDLVRVLVPLAAVLVASTAWAASTGRLRHVAFVVSGYGADASSTAAAAPPARAGLGSAARVLAAPRVLGAAPPRVLEDAPVGEPAVPSSSAPVADEPAAAPPAAATTSTSTTAPTSSRSRGGVDDPPEIRELYAAAHRAHFADRSWAVALAAWDRYLASAPRGRFAVEARYNRALCLARLGRAGEARSALEPFARGAFGGYRREEARALVDALGGSAADGSGRVGAAPAKGRDR